MEIKIDIENNSGLKKDVTIQDLNISFLSETACLLGKFNTYDLQGKLIICNGFQWDIILKEKFPESENTLVSWKAYFGTEEFYNDLKLYVESKNE